MSDMNDPVVARIEANPKYHELKRKRSRFGWQLTVLMLLVYYGYMGLIAFDKELLSRPLGAGVTTLGHPDRAGRDPVHRAHHRPVRAPREQRVRPPDRRDPEGRHAMSRMHSILIALAMLLFAGAAWAGGGDLGQAEKQPINWTAISMFAAFVGATLWITKWAAAKTTVGGGLLHGRRRHHRLPERPGDRRRLHVGGLVPRHLRQLVIANGYDGLIYSIGFLVGWPVITFLMAERCATSASSPSPTSPPTASSRPRSARSRPPARWWWWRST